MTDTPPTAAPDDEMSDPIQRLINGVVTDYAAQLMNGGDDQAADYMLAIKQPEYVTILAKQTRADLAREAAPTRECKTCSGIGVLNMVETTTGRKHAVPCACRPVTVQWGTGPDEPVLPPIKNPYGDPVIRAAFDRGVGACMTFLSTRPAAQPSRPAEQEPPAGDAAEALADMPNGADFEDYEWNLWCRKHQYVIRRALRTAPSVQGDAEPDKWQELASTLLTDLHATERVLFQLRALMGPLLEERKSDPAFPSSRFYSAAAKIFGDPRFIKLATGPITAARLQSEPTVDADKLALARALVALDDASDPDKFRKAKREHRPAIGLANRIVGEAG